MKRMNNKIARDVTIYRNILQEFCDENLITPEQKYILEKDFKADLRLEEIENQILEESKLEENPYTRKEQYDKVRKLIYEKCAEGKISEYTREDLLKRVQKSFFEAENGQGNNNSADNAMKKSFSEAQTDVKKLETDVKKTFDNLPAPSAKDAMKNQPKDVKVESSDVMTEDWFDVSQQDYQNALNRMNANNYKNSMTGTNFQSAAQQRNRDQQLIDRYNSQQARDLQRHNEALNRLNANQYKNTMTGTNFQSASVQRTRDQNTVAQYANVAANAQAQGAARRLSNQGTKPPSGGQNGFDHMDEVHAGIAKPAASVANGGNFAMLNNNVNANTANANASSALKTMSNDQVAKDVIRGKYGNGPARVEALKKAGYDPAAIQKSVNAMLKK